MAGKTRLLWFPATQVAMFPLLAKGVHNLYDPIKALHVTNWIDKTDY
jgi:hypothetical protein